ncbi:hypothetical protein MTR67_012273 [Solanum verrucosum]|uniref:Uncharacterized protein n=1 Tax=Solanum verrucosum TaxID=315347 RepID=A0AAF0QA17_SOLVR|nr:hypothetical protein MTR67_012273 [Solanum verrucosum]
MSSFRGRSLLNLNSNHALRSLKKKLNKFDIERKEQELTAKNAQTHQQKVDNLERITVTEKRRIGN